MTEPATEKQAEDLLKQAFNLRRNGSEREARPKVFAWGAKVYRARSWLAIWREWQQDQGQEN